MTWRRLIMSLWPSRRKQAVKQAMRQSILLKRRSLSVQEVNERSVAIIARIEAMPVFQSAESVLCYWPIQGEVDLRPLMEHYLGRKTILLPVSHPRSMDVHPYTGCDCLEKGRFGILEPRTPLYEGRIDLVLVPGVAFDSRHHRLGRGGGYYDRFLQCCSPRFAAGVAYDFQIVEEVPTDRWDQPMDCLVTESGII